MDTDDNQRPGSGVLPGSLAVAVERPMVGRVDEIATMSAIWSVVRRGPMGAILLGGEAGAGKTRLAAEMAAQVIADGGWVAHGQCDRSLSLPFEPLVQIAEQLVEQLECSGAPLDPPVVNDLALIVPSLADRLGRGRRAERNPEEERYRAVAAFGSLLATVSRQRPLLVVIDDLHWAGPQTLAAVSHLVRIADLERILLVGTFRDTGDEITEPLASMLADLRRSDRVTRIGIGGLDPAEVRALLGTHVGATGNQLSAVARDVADRTGGNPFLVIELCRDVPVEVLATAVPDAVVEVVADRLHRMSTDAVAVAEVIAVAGRTTLALLADVLGNDAATGGVVELVGSGMIVELTGTVPAYQYSHALLQDAVRGRLVGAQRASIHLSVARAIEATEADLRSWSAALTEHYVAAASVVGPDRAVHYGKLAAADARSTAAYEEALGLLSTVAELLPAGDRDRVAVLTEVVELVARSGQSNDVGIAAARAAVAEAADSGHDDLFAEVAIHLERLAQFTGLFAAEAEVAVLAALERTPLDDRERRSRLLASSARAAALQGRAEANEMALAALDEARALDDPATMLAVLEPVMIAVSDARLRLDLSRDLTERFELLDDPWRQMWGTANGVTAMFELGLLHQAKPLIERQRRFATRYRFGLFEFQTHVMRAAIALAEDQLDDAELAIDAVDSMDSQVVKASKAGVHGLLMFLLHRSRGALEVMRPVVSHLVRDGVTAGVWLPGLAAACAELGLIDDAERLLEQMAADGFAAIERDSLRGASLALLVDVAAHAGRADLAARLEPELRTFEGTVLRGGMHVMLGPADASLAVVAKLTGRSGDASEWHDSALDMARRAGANGWRRRIEHTWEVARSGNGGLAPVGTIHDGASTESTQVDPDGLSARELEVLACLARGGSNRQIGTELFISPNTVANHVRAILAKTGCANRTEAAAYAVRRQTTAARGG